MTSPAPDTGADAAPDTGPPADPPAPDAPETGPDWEKEADKWKTLSRKHEGLAKANKKALDDLAAKSSGEPSLEDLQRRLTDADKAREAAESRAAELAYANTVNRVAGRLGADPEALLDSGSFRDAVADELGDDFTDADLTQAVEKIAGEFAKKARFGARTGPVRSGGDLPGGPSGTGPITEDQLSRMSHNEIAKAQSEGKLKHLM